MDFETVVAFAATFGTAFTSFTRSALAGPKDKPKRLYQTACRQIETRDIRKLKRPLQDKRPAASPLARLNSSPA